MLHVQLACHPRATPGSHTREPPANPAAEQVVLRAVKKSGLALQFAADELRADKDMVMKPSEMISVRFLLVNSLMFQIFVG